MIQRCRQIINASPDTGTSQNAISKLSHFIEEHLAFVIIRLRSTDTFGLRLSKTDTTFELLELLQLCRRVQFGLDIPPTYDPSD